MSYSNVDRGALAMLALEGAANAIRKTQPDLTREQAFAKAYSDPANRIAAQTERQASRERLSGFPVASNAAEVIDPDDDADIKAMIELERRLNPYLSDEQLYAPIATSEPVLRARANFNAALQAARRAGCEAPSPRSGRKAGRCDVRASSAR
jgi:hypothetical protein